MSDLEYGAIPGTLVTGALGCLLPYMTKKLDKEVRGTVLVRGNAFAAGVLSSAGLVHLLPDATESITFTKFPFASCLAGVVFIVLLFIEMVSHRPIRQTPPPPLVNGIDQMERVQSPPPHANLESPLLAPNATAPPPKRQLHVYVLAIGLVAHSIIAGLALSLTGRPSTQIGILVAVLAHKAFAAFALGNSTVRKGWSLSRAAPLLAFFCCSTPLGIGIGLGIKTTITSDSNQAVPILQAGASGVFLYMGFWHLLHDMITDIDLVDFFIYALGYGTMSTLAIWT
ncbi:hypothetical protein PTSG_02903 [Salpingoeca rosetta]|uniref:Zinc/iron permease n=1 Tax=Salpingoeca rosetta (strain ATCC 50818 / BSB-021) TaxID=946362 RepID=F2U3N8_SALR5|nr:uncharacterized protein PTSG_02903 [Salpingoeca rosetta]EGD82232.1 hypothetical protein PTSG_02903 [Salpingoeca rosetta]|eukprot:XP_004996415.1 hypothetical protein PTSG_02903 [Salpingoeca rosetta]